MATLEFSVDLEGLPKSYTRAYREIWRRIGVEVIERIRARTLSGLDANGKPFGEYAAGGGRIDLHDTGRMLESMTVKQASGVGFELTVGTEYARYVDKRFNFFALSKADVDYIEQRAEQLIFDFLVDPKRQRRSKAKEA